ncbi:hypothetical protein [Flavivirga algicola]|uniref:Uncharacterized protein n=1 Tax=Flavivirga algicola TaxID=2729136 RepID=A0ABX1RXD2_9FLAO|nr:hypothetical protein [Flavivirga algicola]NMH87698.1 hypothetical protein [Flavivirga algicola]
MKNEISLDLSSNQDILNTINHLMHNFNEIAKDSWDNSGIEFHNSLNDTLITLEASIHPNIPGYSELAFYLKATENKDNFNKIAEYIQLVIEKNSVKPIWMNEEIPMGLSAGFSLANADKRYIINFIDLLRTLDLNHEVYETFFIEILLGKWKICDETLLLLAARSGSLSGQWGIENYEIPPLNPEQKNTYIKYLLEDTLKSKVIDTGLLIDALEFLDISIDNEKFKSLFKNYKPIFNESNIPILNHL